MICVTFVRDGVQELNGFEEMPDFLLEIGCEEIPARMIADAETALGVRVAKLLFDEGLLPATTKVPTMSTPRRLTVWANGIFAAQPDVTEQINGPSVQVAYKDGQPTAAAHAFAKKAGVDVSQLQKITTAKGEYLAAKVTKKGRSAAEILAENLPKEISSIYWPKNMYWRKPNERFVRPVRWLVAMLDAETIPLEFDGILAGNISRGHRILSDGGVTISRPGFAYVDALRAAKVLGRAEREQQIRKALDAATRPLPGARWREDKELLRTVVNLTEFPSAVMGELRSAVSRSARRSAGHGDARPSEVFCFGRSGRQTAAEFSCGAEYRWRSGGVDPARQRACIAGAVQRRAIFLAH